MLDYRQRHHSLGLFVPDAMARNVLTGFSPILAAISSTLSSAHRADVQVNAGGDAEASAEACATAIGTAVAHAYAAAAATVNVQGR